MSPSLLTEIIHAAVFSCSCSAAPRILAAAAGRKKRKEKKKDLGRVLAGLGGVLSNRVRDKRNEMCAKGKEACYLIIYYNMSAY